MNPCIPYQKEVIVPHTPVISESEVSFMLVCQLVFNPFHMPLLYQLSSESEVPITLLCQLCSTYFTDQELFKDTFVIKVDNMKNTDDFCYAKKAITRWTLFAVNKHNWGTGKKIHCMSCGVPKMHLLS